MIDSYITGVGMTRFGKMADRTVEDLGREAVRLAMKEAGVDRKDVDEVFCGSVFGGVLIGQRIMGSLGMSGLPVTNIENGCSSGSTALRDACAAIATGRAETAVVIGIDQLTRLGGGALPLEKTDIEVNHGMVMPALYAMRARRYMHERGATPKDLAQVSVKARAAAAHNPYAQIRKSTTTEEVLASRMVSDPLTLFMCCPTGDGAAAVVVSRKKNANSSTKPIRIASSTLQSGTYKTGFRDLSNSELTLRTSRIAYEEAGIGPKDVDVAEVHDAFAIAELMYYEALGFCEPGEGVAMLARGDSSIGGKKPVNPSGGLLCRGHPVGATGIAQICELVWQLRGEAGGRQVQGAKVGLSQCTGGGVSGFDHGACTVNILVA